MKGLFVSLSFLLVVCCQYACSHEESYHLVVPPSLKADCGLTLYTTNSNDAGKGIIKSYHENNKIRKKIFQTSANNHTAVSLDGNQHTLYFKASGPTPRVKLQSGPATFHDAYLPLPDACLGTLYRVSTLAPGDGEAFMMIASWDSAGTVTVHLDDHLPGTRVTMDGKEYGPGDRIQFQMKPEQTRVITSKTHSLDGIQVYSPQPIAVFAGNHDGRMDANNQSNTLIEMFPPIEMLGTRHVVVLPEGATSATIKVISFYLYTELSVSTYTDQEQADLDITMDGKGRTWTYTQTGHVTIISNKPVLVVQYISGGASSSSAMTFIPPKEMWVNTYSLHALQDSSSSMKQVASVVIKTEYIAGFLGVSLTDSSDMTSLLQWKTIGQSEYSTVTLPLSKNTVILLRHFNPRVTFQVIQTGLGETSGAYALPAGVATACGRLDGIVDFEDSEMEASKETAERDEETPEQRVRRAVSRFGLVFILTASPPPPQSTEETTLLPFQPVISVLTPAILPPPGSTPLPSIEETTEETFLTVNIIGGGGNSEVDPSSTLSSLPWSSSTFESISAAATDDEEPASTEVEPAVVAGAATAAGVAVGVTAAVVIAVKLTAAAAVAPAGAAAAAGASAAGAAGATQAGTTAAASMTAGAANGTAPMATGQTMATFHSGMAANGNAATAGFSMAPPV